MRFLRLHALLDRIGASYWFIPSIMAVLCTALAFAMVELDRQLGADWLRGSAIAHLNEPEGARQLLSTIAGSMITVAGVSFAITISAFVTATTQFGPRLISNFMRDRGNQVTLGTFIATFLYCVLVLRAVQSADGDVPSFVPHLAITVAILLTLASLGTLIFFVHHVPESLNVSNMVADVGHRLNSRILQLFPEEIGHGPKDDSGTERQAERNWASDDAAPVESLEAGYIQELDTAALMRIASERDLVLRVDFRPGDFVITGKALLWALPRERLEEASVETLRSCFIIGQERTPVQDVAFLINQLVEVATRALSPGVNDPFTAINCIDWLGSALTSIGRRTLSDPARHDAQGRLRIIAPADTFEGFAAAAFGQLRPYAASDPNAALHLLRTIDSIIEALPDQQQQAVLLDQATALVRACRQNDLLERDLKAIEARLQGLRADVASPRSEHPAADRPITA